MVKDCRAVLIRSQIGTDRGGRQDFGRERGAPGADEVDGV